MSFKRTIGFITIFLVLCSVVLIGVLYTFSYVLPKILESKLISELETDTGISDFAFDVRELDLEGADFGNVRFGSEKTPALVIGSIQIDYSLEDLYQKKIKKVLASGVELYCVYRDGNLRFRGIDLKKIIERLQSRMREDSVPSDAETLLALERLTIRNATIICEINNQTYRAPFEIEILPDNSYSSRLRCMAHIYMWGQKVLVAANIDVNQKTVSLDFSSKNVSLAKFANFTQMIEGLNVSGQANLEGSVKLIWEPFSISSFVSSLELHNTKIRFNRLHLQNPLNQKQEELPLRIKLESFNGKTWKASASAITGTSPVPFTLSKINSSIKLTKGDMRGSGNFFIAPNNSDAWQVTSMPLKIVELLPMRVNFSINHSKNGKWVFGLKNQIIKKDIHKTNTFMVDQFEIKTKIPIIELSGDVSKNKSSATYRVKIPDIHLTSEWSTIELPALSLAGTADINHEGNGSQAVAFKVQSPNSEITLNSIKIRIPNVTLSVKLQSDKKFKRRMDGLLRWTNVSIGLPKINANFSGMQAALPFQWPIEAQGKKGNFSIKAMDYQNIHLGTLSGTMQQTAQGLSFEGTHQNQFIPKRLFQFRGNTKLLDPTDPETNVHFQLATSNAKTDIDLGAFFPAAAGVTINGNLVFDGDIAVGKHGISGALNSKLNRGRVLLAQENISIDGIRVALSIPDLPNIHSAPKQQLFFDKAAMGGIEVNDGKIEFQIESLKSLFIEKSQFKWCDGNVDTYAIRVSAGLQDYRLILYCDRLNMAKVLEQFGAATAVGQGTVNGRIPLRYHNGKISFDDGFLFSTPGEKGKIRLTDTEILTAGIAPNTPQYIQMELAREALKDYDVSWAKLNITSEGEDLLLKMQLDGKPANPLPFVYQKDLGGFTKIEAGGKGSIFQGIRLDVNFRLPLNKMLRYKDLIRKIQ
jgi:hypothetical protein